MPKISIIIPVYNVEAYLRRCLDSCINQTFKDIEVIVVNDASPDNCDIIMREYEEKYSDLIRCIYLKENIKQGGARNRGIEIAQGKYVTFVDSDDWIDKSYCEKLYNSAIINNADLVIANAYRVVNDYKTLYRLNKSDCDEQNVSLSIVLGEKYSIAAWGRLIKKELIIKNSLIFPEKKFLEDQQVVGLWLLKAEIINSISNAIYYYVYRDNSIMSTLSIANLFESLDSLCAALSKAREINESDNIYFLNFIFSRVSNLIINFIMDHRFKEDLKINLYKSRMKEYLTDIEMSIYKTTILSYKKDLLKYFFKYDNFFSKYLNRKIILKSVYIWGYGKYGHMFYNYLIHNGIRPIGFLDSRKDIWGLNDTKYKAKVYNFDEIKDKAINIIVAINDYNAFEEIRQYVFEQNPESKVEYYLEYLLLE